MSEETIPMASKKINGFDEWDVKNAADALIRAQEIRDDKRKGFYAAVKKELAEKVTAAEKAALETKVTAKLHGVFRKGD